jgi:hypothetical protein
MDWRKKTKEQRFEADKQRLEKELQGVKYFASEYSQLKDLKALIFRLAWEAGYEAKERTLRNERDQRRKAK